MKGTVISQECGFYKSRNALEFRSYIRSVYSYLFLGLLCMSLSIYMFTNDFIRFSAFYCNYRLIIVFAPLIMLLFVEKVIDGFSVLGATIYYFSLCFIIGLGFAPMVMFYRDVVVPALLISSGMFLGMSIYGYLTDRDLTSLSSYVVFGSIGLFISLIVEWFYPQLFFINNIIGVGLSLIFIAYDTHNIKRLYYSGGYSTEKHAIFGALLLFVDFYNLLMFLLRILGGDRRKG